MRGFLLALSLVAGLGTTARAQDAAAIQDVISDQIAAFRADDVGTAFTFASPTIRKFFGTPDQFGKMVRQGYPMVWRPRDVRFAGIEQRGGRTVQRVLLTDDSGALHMLEYQMVPGEGGWRIDGVRLIEPDAAAA